VRTLVLEGSPFAAHPSVPGCSLGAMLRDDSRSNRFTDRPEG
jgi:hypothetical protein